MIFYLRTKGGCKFRKDFSGGARLMLGCIDRQSWCPGMQAWCGQNSSSIFYGNVVDIGAALQWLLFFPLVFITYMTLEILFVVRDILAYFPLCTEVWTLSSSETCGKGCEF